MKKLKALFYSVISFIIFGIAITSIGTIIAVGTALVIPVLVFGVFYILYKISVTDFDKPDEE
ncbi:MAG: hypothetical protein COA63_014175 [Methylophaga sp.]|nr:hypothetical protein [Methylophaga sp.]